MDCSLLPEPGDIIVDKENNEWVLTYSMNDDQTTFRLRLNYRTRYGPNPAICEIRKRSDQPFREVGRMMFAPVELDPDC